MQVAGGFCWASRHSSFFIRVYLLKPQFSAFLNFSRKSLQDRSCVCLGLLGSAWVCLGLLGLLGLPKLVRFHYVFINLFPFSISFIDFSVPNWGYFLEGYCLDLSLFLCHPMRVCYNNLKTPKPLSLPFI